ncbi:protein PHYLLO, chloroplastic isoform X1 [Dendrobium catenatum]|uniref:Protein PHYLLO, chloroplastic n=3 Tax=Dendrobium catenatum TaxID=906689 RepID=A0A2I0VDM6_9ASPA|nr:protein PHYLLO, chloroplastic isoform X1 [Dendrobium catenatum]PKU61520.1 Protein PHYLLO, chloroplastic [Dendrobium catenatum]
MKLQSSGFFHSSKPSLLHSNHRIRSHSLFIPSSPFRLSLPFHCRNHPGLFYLRSNPNSQIYAQKEFCARELNIVVDEFVETGCSDLPVELCLTRTLDPALTLMQAVNAMKEAVNKLKIDPPCSRSGVLRFQIVVPPSVKSLNWLYLQCKSLAPFPQIYVATTKMHERFNGLTITTQMLGVSGVGSAITFCGSSGVLRGYNLMERYLSLESPLISAYGFIGIDWNMESKKMFNHPGSFYFFIPQIEVNEFENVSFLASNLVWDNSLSYPLEEAVHSLERSLNQINVHVSSASTLVVDKWNWFEGQSGIEGKEDFKMVHINAETLQKMHASGRFSSLEELTGTDKSYYRNSTTVIVSKNMFRLPHGTSKIKECTNINLLWASLIVEECVRLGLKYFCIAPGSRSSPLALSACSHSLTTCISCYDERSLAFHALGYARGSHKPAVIITSSGTAVSNLFPAVVEASQDFVPLLMLTADRPPELQDVGANQAIDQVNHFGKFVRFFYSFPPPSDQIPARMVLTTIDSAVYSATQSLCGPVHLNCPFREPLEDVPKEWATDCLRGLDLWMSKEEPFTQYIKIQHAWGHCYDQMAKVLDVIHNANQGLLLLGAINTDDEIWAALLLAKHLSWPVVPDVLSGLRLRKLLTSCPGIEDDFLFLDHLDHVLLSESVKSWLQPDVVVQIGSRITSKRVSQLLDSCSPFVYIFVDKHPNRQDPSHLVTHRVQCSIVEFTELVLVDKCPKRGRKWSLLLKELNLMVAMEISFQIYSEISLTEPYVAHLVGQVLRGDTALFIGNSMAIRDMDMYGKGWLKPNHDSVFMETSCNLAFMGLRVSGNRGASGIDGLLSSSIGFAVGSKKRVVCVIGDVSFLHDTNSLAILSNRTRRKPMTIIVINNHGGAIFSLLPIASRTQESVLNQYFYTSHNISIGKLCSAHRVKHLLVQTKMELQHALHESQQDYGDFVIEVESCITDNAKFHSIVRKSSGQAADQAFRALSVTPMTEIVTDSLSICKICNVEYSLYRIQLCAPTSTQMKHYRKDFYHEGFVLAISLDDNIVGYGEIAPIEIHKENLLDVEEQLRFLVHVMEGAELSCLLPLLRGSFSRWIWKILGIPPSSVFPSVRCGMEMAILNALAKRQGSSLSGFIGYESFLLGTQKVADKNICKEEGIPICALVDCDGTPNVVAHVVSQLFHDGFTTVKIKVARREDPTEDAAVISEIRAVIGYKINIRVDANRKWSYDKAFHFGSSVKSFALEYIEEPVCFEDDIIKFCEETGLPVALDETIDNISGEALQKLEKFVHPGIVAVVIKPSMVGGFENALLIAKWAQMHEKMTIVSSAFESSLGLSTYVKFAHYLDQLNKSISEMRKVKQTAPAAHGLGTFQWLKEDVSTEGLRIRIPPHGKTVEASIGDTDIFLRNFQVNPEVIQRIYRGEQVKSYKSEVDCNGLSCSFKLMEAGGNKDGNLIFLHGFLGSGQDWIPLMKAFSATTRCISIDLPGHGDSCVQWHKKNLTQEPYQSIESVAEMLLQLINNITIGKVILVGYSMGGRIALYMSLKYCEKIHGAVLISGSPGLRNENAQRIRLSQDEARASYLLSHGLNSFLETWYEGSLWKSLRAHPLFNKIVRQREKHQDIRSLAKSLTDLSTGRQRPLWDELRHCKNPVLLIVGEEDLKFRRIAEEMCNEIKSSCADEVTGQEDLCEMVIVPECGHAVHLENPFPVINAVRKFFTRVNRK